MSKSEDNSTLEYYVDYKRQHLWTICAYPSNIEVNRCLAFFLCPILLFFQYPTGGNRTKILRLKEKVCVNLVYLFISCHIILSKALCAKSLKFQSSFSQLNFVEYTEFVLYFCKLMPIHASVIYQILDLSPIRKTRKLIACTSFQTTITRRCFWQ